MRCIFRIFFAEGTILLLLLLCIGTLSLAQEQVMVTGSLRTIAGKPVQHATILLRNKNAVIIAFGTSTADGKFLIRFAPASGNDSLYLEVSNIAYKKEQQSIKPGKVIYDFVLHNKAVELPEVIVKSKPAIVETGDTLSYKVSSFSRNEDRSIGEVIRRLPGVTVEENGQISFNGKAISNLYIHGDDLMDGRYGLPTRTINKEMIESIDLIRNFQPLKVLKDKVVTDDVAMNLVLKNENSLKLSGQAITGAGWRTQYEVAANLMLFNKKFKMLNSLKSNNSGINYGDDFLQFGSADYLYSNGNTRPSPLISTGTAAGPDLPRKNFYINRSLALNANNLLNTRRQLQLRSNVQVFVDRNTLNYQNRVDNYLENDTISYREQQRSLSRMFLVNTAFTASVNKPGYFLNNLMRLNFSGARNTAAMILNNTAFPQRLTETVTDLSNDLNFTPAIGSRSVMQLKWYVNYYNAPQQLNIHEGLNPEVLNAGLRYAAIQQEAATPTFFSHAMLSWRFLHTTIRQHYQAGILNERQQLNTSLWLLQADSIQSKYAGDAGNALRWSRNRFYISSDFDIHRERWEAGISLPLILQNIAYRDAGYVLNRSQHQFLINPSARIRIKVHAEDHLLFNYSYNNNVGNISGIYRGAILSNYRSVKANDADVQETSGSTAALVYNFQRSIKMLFINAGIIYNQVKANSIVSGILTNNIQRTILLPLANDQSSISANFGISKYLFGLNTTAGFKTTYRVSRFDQFINMERLPVISQSLSLGPTAESRLPAGVTLSYAGVVNFMRGRFTYNEKSSTINQLWRMDQQIALGYSPVKNLFSNFRARSVHSRQSSVSSQKFIFGDLNVRYKHTKWRTDFELDVTNIANQRNYRMLSVKTNMFSENSYEIRGRMVMVRAVFGI